MYQKVVFCMFLLLFPVAMVVAQDTGSNGSDAPAVPPAAVMPSGAGGDQRGHAPAGPVPTGAQAPAGDPRGPAPAEPVPTPDGTGDSEAKMVSGMSVLGNKEAPMSLFIVPWKTSELGSETSLSRTLNEREVPVDREVFMRELAFYQVSAGNATPTAVSQLSNSH